MRSPFRFFVMDWLLAFWIIVGLLVATAIFCVLWWLLGD